MKLSITPVPDHTPGYPRMVEITDWEGLLAPSGRRVFGPRVLLCAGLLGSALLLPIPGHAGPFKASNPEAVAIAEEVLNKEVKGSWYKQAKFPKSEYVEGNPKITVPSIPISFGNSYTGIIDANRTKDATRELFAAYGITLLPDYPLKRAGMEFRADGWDPERNVGFELVQLNRDYEPPVEELADPERLSHAEFKRLVAEVGENEMTIFAAPHGEYPVMDNDARPAMRAYLQSVLDYLDWLKKQGRL